MTNAILRGKPDAESSRVRFDVGKVVLIGAVACALPLFAKVELATPFSDGVVLQRGMEVPVWGKAEPGRRVTVEFAGAAVSAVARPDGCWKVKLPRMEAARESRVLTVTESAPGWLWDTARETVEVKDVLVGEVWLCSGQSNAECPIWGGNPRYRDGWGAMTLASVNKPFVHFVKMPRVASPAPRHGYRVQWTKMTPGLYEDFKAGKPMPSAMGYYYALELANALDVPIGIVDSSWGGSNIDAWTPPSGYAGLEGLDAERDWKYVDEKDWKPEMRKGPISGWNQQPTLLWNGMVAAFAPMACRGVVWYQGCHNAGEPERYAAKMHALYNGWAKEFANPGLKLYFAQLAPWGLTTVAQIQMAQAKFAAEEPNAAMSVINDVGNIRDIHPNDKRTVAKRLSLHALRRDYGWTSVRDNSPTLRSWRLDGGRFVMTFDDAEGWYVYNPDLSPKVGFEVCGADGVWKPAQLVNLVASKGRNGKPYYSGEVKGRDLIVASDAVKEPVKLRYLHSSPWFGALYNDACLPLGAFAIEKGAVR